MTFIRPTLLALASALLSATAAQAQLWHRETLPDIRVASLAYDAEVCGVWIANESNELILISTFGKERLRFETDMLSYRCAA